MPKYFLIFCLLFFYLTLSATIIHIPADQPTIQAGIDIAVDADTVLVAPGTYTESINFSGKNILVASYYITSPDSNLINETIIDGSQTDRVVTFEGEEDSTAVLCGFTIQNGAATEGGGISCINYSNPTLDHLLIILNDSDKGGAVFCSLSSPTLTNCTIVANTSQFGGAVYAEVNSQIDVINCILWGNTPQEVYFSDQDYLILQSFEDLTTNEADNNMITIDLNEYITTSTPLEDLTIDITAEFSAIDGEVTIDENFMLTADFFPQLNYAYHVYNELTLTIFVSDGITNLEETALWIYQPEHKGLHGFVTEMYSGNIVTGTNVVSDTNIGNILTNADSSQFIAFYAAADTSANVYLFKEGYYESHRYIGGCVHELNGDTEFGFTFVPIIYDPELQDDRHELAFSTTFRGYNKTIRYYTPPTIVICDAPYHDNYNPSAAEVQLAIDAVNWLDEFTDGFYVPNQGENLLIVNNVDDCAYYYTHVNTLTIYWQPSHPGAGGNGLVPYANYTIMFSHVIIKDDTTNFPTYLQEVFQAMGPNVDNEYFFYSIFCDYGCIKPWEPTDIDLMWGHRQHSRMPKNHLHDIDDLTIPGNLESNFYAKVWSYFDASVNGNKVRARKLIGYQREKGGEILTTKPEAETILEGAQLVHLIDLTPKEGLSSKTLMCPQSKPRYIASRIEDNILTLNWNSMDLDVVNSDREDKLEKNYCNIYMSIGQGQFELLETTQTDNYELELDNEGLYRFYMNIVYNDEKISPDSDIIEVAYQCDAPRRFTKLCSKSIPKLSNRVSENNIHLEWEIMPTGSYDKNGDSFYMEYNYSLIYVSYQGKDYQLLYETEDTEYDFTLPNKGSYNFYVQAVYNDEQITPHSNYASIDFGKEELILVYSYENELKQKTKPIQPKDRSREVDLSSITINYSDLQGGEAGIISNEMADVYWQEGNLEEDPLLSTNYHLTEGSPCIDAGDPGFPLDPDNTIIDMGAFYFSDQDIIVDEIYPEPGEITINEGDSINFYIIAIDPDGEELEYSWKLDEEEMSVDSSYTFLTDNNSSGEYEVTLDVTDNYGIRENRNSLSFNWNVIVEDVNIVDDIVVPTITELYQNVPNPFNPETTVRFDLSKTSNVSLEIYNVKGQKIKTLINTTLEPGVHTFIWNGDHDNGNPVASGVYFYKLRAGEFEQVRKMMVLK